MKTVHVLGTETDEGNGFNVYATRKLAEAAYIATANDFYKVDAKTFEEAQELASAAVDKGSMDFIFLNECEVSRAAKLQLRLSLDLDSLQMSNGNNVPRRRFTDT